MTHGSTFKLTSVSFQFISIILWAFHYLLAQNVLGSSCISPAPVLELPFSPRISGFFEQTVVFLKQDLGTKCAHYYWGIIAPSPSQKTELNNTFICNDISISLSLGRQFSVDCLHLYTSYMLRYWQILFQIIFSRMFV